MKKILFVCMGNICRSPTGEGVFRQMLENQKMSNRFEVDSAGTIGFHSGKSADHRMQKAASEKGYRLESRSRQVRAEDFEAFDLVIAMDRDNLADLIAVGASRFGKQDLIPSKIKLLSDFLGPQWPTDVPDPYYGGDEGFDYVLEMVEAACPAILQELMTEGG
ncbi:low molecular weight phosphotyrosine protein phosphatase [bacterium]|nr:low molecular weight phosphotyrosine protein phosphatase [bacterium]